MTDDTQIDAFADSKDPWAWWRKALQTPKMIGHDDLEYAESEPRYGYYRVETKKDLWEPVQIWSDGPGEWFALQSGSELTGNDVIELWAKCCSHPVSVDEYDTVLAGGSWKDEPDKYAYWREELSNPGCNQRDTLRTDLAGFYRGNGAKTKVDFPFAIWPESNGILVVKIGRKDELLTQHTEEYDNFLCGKLWLGCSAVTQEAYDAAIDAGAWHDGKISRSFSKEGANPEPKKEPEQAPDPIEVKNRPAPPPPVEAGIGHNGGPSISDDFASKVKAEAVLIKELTKEALKDQETADKLGEAGTRIRKLKTEANDERVKQKQPHLDAGRAVDNQFNPTIEAAEKMVKAAAKAIKVWKDAETARLAEIAEREAEEKQRLEDERVEREQKAAEEEAAQKQAELQRKAREEAELSGASEEEIANIQVEQVKPKEVKPAKEIRAKKVDLKVGAAAGRSFSTGPTRYIAEITDYDALLMALKDEEQVKEAVRKVAHRLANTKDAELPAGMKRKEDA